METESAALLLPSEYNACSCEIPPQHRHPLRRTPGCRVPVHRMDPGFSHNMTLYAERLLRCHAHCLGTEQELIRSARANSAGILHANPLTSLVVKTKFGG